MIEGFQAISEKDIKKDLKNKDRDEAIRFINYLHKDNDRFLTFVKSKKNGKWESKNISFETATKKIGTYISEKNANYYVSMNGFYNNKRLESSVRHFNALWIDLDYYKIDEFKNKTMQQVINLLRNKGLFEELEPSLFVNSGNGMYIIWLIEHAPKQVIKLWKCCMNKLYDKFKEYGADALAKDVSRVLRLPGTRNQKTNKESYIYKSETPKRYTIKEIGDILLNKKQYESKTISTSFVKTPHFHNKRCIRLLSDFETIIKLRNGEMEGYRECVCFLYRNFAANIFDEATVEQKLIQLNQLFNQPLSEKELLNATKSTKHYKYSNMKLIELLDLTREEQLKLKEIRHIEIVKEYRRQYKNKWNQSYSKSKSHDENGLTMRMKNKLNKVDNIKRLLVLGHKQSIIAEKLKINKSTVSKYIKQYLSNLDIAKEKRTLLSQNIKKPEAVKVIFSMKGFQTLLKVKQEPMDDGFVKHKLHLKNFDEDLDE